MNIVTNSNTVNNTPVTMSSLEIAELTGKEHRDVLYDIRNMLIELDYLAAEFSSTRIDSRGKSQPIFNLPKRESLLLVSGYNLKLRAKIIDRWQELEEQLASTPKLPVSYVEALEALVASEKEKLVLTHQLEVAAPKIAFAEAVESSDDLILVRDLAKLIAGNGVDIGEKRLYTWLRENKYLMYDNSPYQSAMDRGLFKVTESIYKQGNQTKITKTTKITGKGQQYLLAKFL
jgi:Rha family phage regulatory protein